VLTPDFVNHQLESSRYTSVAPNDAKEKTLGIVGLIVLLASWMALWASPHLLRPQWVPNVWMAVLIALPCAIVLGIVAGRRSSKWWYFLSGAGLLSLAVMLASVAV
jgi:hypothetical protein